MPRKKFQPGFTIVELIVVISVIAILAAIILVSYGAWRNSTATNAIKSDLTHAASAMESYRTFNNNYPLAIPSTFTASVNDTVTLVIPNAKSFCIEGTTSIATSIKYYIDDLTQASGAVQGTCATRPTAPNTPSNFIASSATESQITLNWDASIGSLNYVVQCTRDSRYVQNLTSSSPTTNSTMISGLTPSSTYYCRVKAVNVSGSSPWSSSVTVFTAALPVPTGVVAAAVSPFQINVSWNDISAASTYTLQVSTNSTFSSVLIESTEQINASYSATGLDPSTTYYFRVMSNNNQSDTSSTWSSVTSTSTSPLPAPTSLATVSSSTTNLAISWSPVGGANTYTVQMANSNTFATIVAQETDSGSPSSAFSAPSQGTNYYFRVKAISASGISSEWSSTYTLSTLITKTSTSSTVSNSSSSLTANWTNNVAAASYKLSISLNANMSPTAASVTLPAGSTTYMFSGLTAGTRYYFKLDTIGSSGTIAAGLSPSLTYNTTKP